MYFWTQRRVQIVCLYLSIQAIVAIDWYRGAPHTHFGLAELATVPLTLTKGLLFILGGFPDVWAWLFVIYVRKVRRRQISLPKLKPWATPLKLTIATTLLIVVTLGFLWYRRHDDGAWWSAVMMGLALPLLFLPVLPKEKSEASAASSNQDGR